MNGQHLKTLRSDLIEDRTLTGCSLLSNHCTDLDKTECNGGICVSNEYDKKCVCDDGYDSSNCDAGIDMSYLYVFKILKFGVQKSLSY